MSGITAAEALAQLGGIKTPEAFQALLDSISVYAEGSSTVLYSGPVGEGLSTSQIAGELKNDPNVRIIDKTEAAKFLSLAYITDKSDPNFEKAKELRDKLDSLYGGNPLEKGTSAYNYLGGAGEGGAWDSVSQRFAAETVGDVHTLTPYGTSERIFGKTELKQMLSNGSNVKNINGIPTEVLKQLSPESAFAAVNQKSRMQTSLLQFGYDADGNLKEVGTSKYLQTLGISESGTHISSDLQRVEGNKLLSDYKDGLDADARTQLHASERAALSELTDVRERYKSEYKAAELAGDIEGMSRTRAFLNKLGPVGAVLEFGLVAEEALAAYAAGNMMGAVRVLSIFGAESLGAWLGGMGAAALLTLLASNPVGWAALAGVSLIGGIFGSYLLGGVADDVNDLFNGAQNWAPRPRDPLALDLDGDGIETLGITSTAQVLFDHDGDGVKTATGWISSDDGLLVLDRNGNGTVDNGGELFGDQIQVNGEKAADGFAALAA